MTRCTYICLVLAISMALQTSSAHVKPSPATRSEWNNPADVAAVSGAFRSWTDAVIRKDSAKIESFHDEGFRAGVGARMLTKAEHIEVELAVGNKEMRLLKIQTRRVGDLLLVWSSHFIRADPVPPIPSLGLIGDWGDAKAAKRGFTQDEFSVWRFEGGQLKCLAFVAQRPPKKK